MIYDRRTGELGQDDIRTAGAVATGTVVVTPAPITLAFTVVDPVVAIISSTTKRGGLIPALHST